MRTAAFLATWVVMASAQAAPPRLAIFSSDADLEALLTAKLDGVVSRSGLPQIAAEKRLTSVPLVLEGADLALVVESGPVGSVRLIEAKTGGTILDLSAPPMPASEEAEWIARRVGPYLGNSGNTEAPRISLIGLRFETDSPINRTNERLANLALANELQKSGAVVLERWRLGDLVFEKSLRHDESPFWKAADLLDGSLSQDKDGFSARLRIRSAPGVERTFRVVSSTIQGLAQEISRSAIKRKPSDLPDEKPNSEALAFLEESRWMLAHGLAREALQAVEAALALGAPGCEPEMLRVKASAMISYPDDLSSAHPYDVSDWANAFPAGELPERVAAATETMHLAGDYWIKHHTLKQPEGWTLEHPSTIGTTTLYTGLKVLHAAHDSGWFRDHAEPVHALREAILRNIGLMADGELGRKRPLFFTYLTNYAGYWNETPADAIAFYRKVLDSDFNAGPITWPADVRSVLAFNDVPHPPFVMGDAPKADFSSGTGSWRVVDWTGDSARSAWLAFLDELALSRDLLKQADSLALRWQTCGDKQERLGLTSRMVDFLDANKDVLAGPLGTPAFSEFYEPLRRVNDSKDLAGAQEKLVRFFLNLLNAPGPLAKDVLTKVWVALESQQNASERQARDLLAALDARENRPETFSADQLVSWEHKLAVAAQNGVWVLESSGWQKNGASFRPLPYRYCFRETIGGLRRTATRG